MEGLHIRFISIHIPFACSLIFWIHKLWNEGEGESEGKEMITCDIKKYG